MSILGPYLLSPQSHTSALCHFSATGLCACFKPFLISRSNLKCSISVVISPQGKSLKNPTDIYAARKSSFLKLPSNPFSLSKKHHSMPGVAVAFFLPRRILIFEKHPSRCLFTLRLICSCRRDVGRTGGSWLKLGLPWHSHSPGDASGPHSSSLTGARAANAGTKQGRIQVTESR